MWGEYIADQRHREYMAYPRAVALSELLWSPRESRNYEEFLIRLAEHLERLDVMYVNYRALDKEPMAVVWQTEQLGKAGNPKNSAYLMAYFGPEEKLFYAVSRDARNWTALNGGEPVFDAKVRLRDPFLNRVKDRFHLVHTKGWDHPVIFHWESGDLIHWAGSPVKVVDEVKKRAWAPEYFYCASEELFYVFWASIHNGHNTIHYVTTKDWTDITPARSAVYYDIGIHDIDLTIVQHKGMYYGFHKPGGVDDRMGNRLSTSTSLDPKKDSFRKDGHGKDVLPEQTRPTEGPEVIKLIGEDKWYIYGDPFQSPLKAWETVDFAHYTKISVSTPEGAKHCSMIPITQVELDSLLKRYGPIEYGLEGER